MSPDFARAAFRARAAAASSFERISTTTGFAPPFCHATTAIWDPSQGFTSRSKSSPDRRSASLKVRSIWLFRSAWFRVAGNFAASARMATF